MNISTTAGAFPCVRALLACGGGCPLTSRVRGDVLKEQMEYIGLCKLVVQSDVRFRRRGPQVVELAS
jgi:hypothetical protein